MTKWDPDSLHKTFQLRAQQAESYAKKCKKEAANSAARRLLHDESLAEFDVCDAIYGKTILDSRSTYLAGLRRMLTETPKYLDEAFDQKRFIQCQHALIKQLIAREEANVSS